MIYIRGTTRVYSMLLRIFMKFDYIGKNVMISPSCEIRRASAPYIYLTTSPPENRSFY